ncbi:PAS-domain containing protein [Colwellia sp. MB02u-18]|uniref:hybrid sensor histidine kinase/response regulator n=1 Tax=unclassified Colwellia TaxID=196834 RepID=UPI0015F51B10|nr:MULTISPECIES: PAS-domain containing protein [unclassified Colwellia]MBA6225628.1 PAS-domain containing protein [Colwellia sp. MB3u-45]MBA6266876.1 PAS-domain containing protein [Colwellia sp. MB3u-43]MBA6321788.1 PAS-domain containing protein [Colwellia sp. MB02u-19]MBA6325018.1 PAS-domain containing protein [Colwellia sp. MB02u-18]MBA6331383.1 PAS-domain containing protein [Colwellia sp. MB02u-12]
MFPNWQLAGLSFAYIGLLFFIAYIGDKYRHKLLRKSQAIIYALTLGVYCTSWSFLGTTGQASSNFISHLPIYLGPILLFIFAWPFIQRIISVSLKLNLTSIADLLAARFGKSHNLAILVTIVALVGTMPYIALQLKAIVYTFQQLQAEQSLANWHFGLIVSLVLAGFTIVFGVRNIDVTERHPGVMLAIAFESLVKLFAFAAVGIFVTYVLFDSPMEIWRRSSTVLNLEQQLNFPNIMSMFAMLVITMAAFLSLPRQFQVMVVELKDEKDTWLSRRIFPLYLLIFAIFAVPLGLAGQLLLGDSVPSDAYVLFLPWYQQQPWLTLLTFLGAISAASSMVIISSIALSTMLSNEIVFPWLYRANKHHETDYDNFRLRLLTIRKILILFVILLGYGVFLMTSPDTLSSLGEIAFGAFAQLTPALVAAFYWRRATLTAVYGGIVIGFGAWLTLNFLPQFGLYPNPFEGGFLPANSMASLLSLSANIIAMWLLSHVSRQSVQERMQVSLFMEYKAPKVLQLQRNKQINYQELELLLSRFVGEEKSSASFIQFQCSTDKTQMSNVAYNQKLLQHTENTLASVMGASSARLVLSSALDGRDIALDEVAVLVEEASSQRQQYSQDLLQSAIENASEGISIVDSELNLVAWNKKYVDLFNYPSELVFQGSPVSDLIRFNILRGLCGVGKVDEQVSKRLMHLRNGSPHSSEREDSDGRVIRIEGNPLPGGGFVMLFSDITVYRQAERGLIEANVDLETRVLERTQKLEQTNDALALAREKAEQSHIKKSLYLKACSHDLMQPLEAARLFTSALASQGNLTATQQRQVDNIDHSLKVANDLVADLAEISRIESGNIKLNISSFSLKSLFDDLAKEFSASALEHEVEFRVRCNSMWLRSDRSLLRRILQNLIGNAFRYASPGKILLGARAKGDIIDIQVLDNGPGIPEEKQTMVFEQFTQLDNQQNSSAGGLGLGLNITQSLAKLLGHPLALSSQVNMGCKFTVGVERTRAQRESVVAKPVVNLGLSDVTVMCIDNDPDVLGGMIELLSVWGCNVLAADSYHQALSIFAEHKNDIEILLVDYQLDADFNGIALITELRKLSRHYVPAVLITATTDSNLEEKALVADIGFMRKLIKPAALRAMMSSMLTKKMQEKYWQ